MKKRKRLATTALRCCYLGSVAILCINGCSAQAPEPAPEAAAGVQKEEINGGTDTSNTTWPWSVRLLVNGSFQCGGSLIAPDWVLTVAHCIYGGNPANYGVELGSGKVIQAAQLIWHPSFLNDSGVTSHDVGLIRLSELALPSSTVGYIRPAIADDALGQTATAIGWGMTNHDETPGNYTLPSALQQVDIPVVPNTCCYNVFPSRQDLFADEQCAGTHDGSQGICFGDSGSPLMLKRSNGVWEHIGAPTGAVSTGGANSCSSYGVFNRTAYFVNWIRGYAPDPAWVPTLNTVIL